MKQNAIRAAAGFDRIDQHAGLRIDHHDGIAIQIGRVEQMAVGEKVTSPTKSSGLRLSPATTGNSARRREHAVGEVNSKTAAREPPPT